LIETSIPGFGTLHIEHLVLDYNGTLACDGKLLPGVKKTLEILAKKLQIHVLTADTFGKAQSQLKSIPCELVILPKENQDIGKLKYVQQLNSELTVCIGNGRNDRLMVKEAALGIAVIQREGASIETMAAADIVCTSIVVALDLLTNPLRLIATLRS